MDDTAPTRASGTSEPPPTLPPLGAGFLAAAADLAAVGLFAVSGRLSHDLDISWTGVMETAWPFLVGLALGWVLVWRRARTWPIDPGLSVWVWAATVLVGLILRTLTGGGLTLAFTFVAVVTLAFLLLGWRALIVSLGFASRGLHDWSRRVARENRRRPPRG